jgi:hypothetical protein
MSPKFTDEQLGNKKYVPKKSVVPKPPGKPPELKDVLGRPKATSVAGILSSRVDYDTKISKIEKSNMPIKQEMAERDSAIKKYNRSTSFLNKSPKKKSS